jgi:ABC-type Fe3+/spermidine/putrescine transport system ATPase subunit
MGMDVRGSELKGSVTGAAGALTIEGVTKRFGGSVVAVDDVSLDLPAGSFFSLLGPSGCGKTTLLRMIAGLEFPDQGHVRVDGIDITREPPERRPFNLVFQRYALFPHFTVAENVAFGLTTNRATRPPRDEVARRVSDMLELVGLAGYEHRKPNQLSGGQAQRVSVARALIRGPRVLLLDEPMAALDRNVRFQVREELLRIHAETGTTFLMVTHDQDEALSISGVVGLMNEGRLEQIADPETLYRRPATLFAARFIGAGSFLPGALVARAHARATVEVGGLRFSAADAIGETSETAVQVLLRPEDLSVVAAGAGRLDGVVETCAFFGSYYELTIRTGIAVIRARAAGARGSGERVAIDWPDEAGIAYASPDGTTSPVLPADADPRAETV